MKFEVGHNRSKRIQIEGQTFNGIEVLELTEKPLNKKSPGSYFKCKCHCGNLFIGWGIAIRDGKTKSCGCLVRNFAKNKLPHPTGAEHPNWNPDLTDEDRTNTRYSDNEFNKWAAKIKYRDSYECKKCYKVGIKLVSHHVLPWNLYPKYRYDLNNGITLCEDCHKKYHSLYGNKKNCNFETFMKFLHEYNLPENNDIK